MKIKYVKPEVLVNELLIVDKTNDNNGYDDASGNVSDVPGLYDLVEEE